MIAETICKVSGQHFSGAVDSVTIETDDGKVFELKQEKGTGELYLIRYCGELSLDKKTANMVYIKVK